MIDFRECKLTTSENETFWSQSSGDKKVEDEVVHLIWNMIIHVSFCAYNYRDFVRNVTKQFHLLHEIAARQLLLLMGSIYAVTEAT